MSEVARTAGGDDPKPGETHVIDKGKGRIFPCARCGADLVYSIGHAALECPYCGSLKQLQIPPDEPIVEKDYEATLYRLAELRESGQSDQIQSGDVNEVRCDSCGGTVVFHGTLTSTRCPYCASTLGRENVHQSTLRIAVDAVLPFQLTSEMATQQIADWIKSLWFAPSSFYQYGAEERNVLACYVPYFTYDAMTFTRYDGQRGDYYFVQIQRGNQLVSQRQIRWTSSDGEFQQFFDDVMVPAVKRGRTDLLDAIQPWPVEDLKPFVPEFLAGISAWTYDVPLDDGFREARRRIDSALSQEVVRRIGGDVQRVTTVKSALSALTYKHLLLPVWLVVYKYRGKTFQIAINGATGRIVGDRPYSVLKIVLTVGLFLALLFVLLIVSKGGNRGTSSFGPDVRFEFQFQP